jgi:predicted RNase H-like nuclease (RuvC/YqgF family)
MAQAVPSNNSNKRLQQTQAQVDDVVEIMKVNVEKVLERDTKLSQLDNRADALQMGASQFEQSAGALKRKFWWKNLKMMLILGAVIGILVIAIIVWIVNSVKSDSPYSPAPLTQAPNNSN